MSESSLDGETSVDIGFVNENEKTRETRLVLHSSTFYPCKLGGKPQWLDYKNLKSLHDDFICGSCSFRLSFLLQIYAPLNQNKVEKNNKKHFNIIVCNNTCSQISTRRPNQVTSIPHSAYLYLVLLADYF